MEIIRGVLVAILAFRALLCFAPAIGIGEQTAGALTLLPGLVFTLLHGGLTLGKTRMAVFIGIAVLVSFSCEVLGVATGWVFGSYHFTDHLGPRVLGVPPAIQTAYVGMGYASMIMARIILGAERTSQGWGMLAVALCGTAVMVAWDVSVDPGMSTVAGLWIWRDGGAFFGVPIHNYAGWFCVVFVFQFLYLKYESANPLAAFSGVVGSRVFWSLPVIYYLLNAADIVLAPIVAGGGRVMACPQNYAGSLDTFRQSMALVCVFVMGVPALIALCRLRNTE